LFFNGLFSESAETNFDSYSRSDPKISPSKSLVRRWFSSAGLHVEVSELSADWPDSSTSHLTTSSSPLKLTDLNVQACRRKSTPN
jgi:hypothetical protein